MVRPEDVHLAYRLILGREPESPAVVDMLSRSDSVDEIAQRLLASDEFRRRLVRGAANGETRWVCAEIRHGLKIWVDLLDAGVAAGVLEDDWETAETNFVLSVLRPGDIFLDIGANIGWFTILGAHAVGPSGHVHAFEPRPDLFGRLAQSVLANEFTDRCTTHALALGDRRGEMTLAAFPSEHNPGHSFLVEGALPPGARSFGAVPIAMLDGLELAGPVRLIKLDVEGAEALVVRGAAALLRRDKPIIVSEIFPKYLAQVSQTSAPDYVTLLQSFGYRLFRLEDAGIGSEIHVLPRDCDMSEDGYFTVIALSPAAIDEMLLRPLDQRVTSLEALLQENERAFSRETADLRAALAKEREAAESAHRRLAQLRAEADATHAELDRARSSADQARDALARAQSRTRRVAASLQVTREQAIASWTGRLQRLRRELHQVASENERLRAELHEQRLRLGRLESERAIIESSTMWRASRPVRKLGQRLPAPLRRNVTRAARVAWWTASLQLPARLQTRAKTRAAALTAPAPAAVALPSSEPTAAPYQPAVDGLDRPLVMLIDTAWPQPDKDAGSIESINMVHAFLAGGYRVLFAAVREQQDASRYRDELTALGAYCLEEPHGPQAIQSFIETHGQLVTAFVLIRVDGGAQFYELIRYNCPQAKIIFHTIDLHFLREERQARLKNDDLALRDAGRTRDREQLVAHGADAVIVVSTVERDLLRTSVPGANVVLLPLSRETKLSPPAFERRSGIGFVGGFAHEPNRDAVSYFLRDIWPLVLKDVSDAEFSIAGDGLPPELLRGAPGQVRYLGFLPDIDPWFDRVRLTVAPLRYGAGTKGKVTSSLAAGVPCVVTPLAAEGMSLQHEVNALVANTPEQFAAEVVRLHRDRDLWERLSVEGQATIEREYSIATYNRTFHELLIGVGLPMITPT